MSNRRRKFATENALKFIRQFRCRFDIEATSKFQRFLLDDEKSVENISRSDVESTFEKSTVPAGEVITGGRKEGIYLMASQ